jgi:ribosomal protein S27AE
LVVWECNRCHEKLEDSFEVCWNCGILKDGSEDSESQRAEEPIDDSAVEPLGHQIVEGQPTERRVCSKCGSQEVIPDVRIIDRGHGNSRRDLEVEVYESPDALIFKGTHAGTLIASICGRCGYTELCVSNPGELLEVYRRNKRA